MGSPVVITSAYAFQPIDDMRLSALQKELRHFGAAHALEGLVLLATEGINATVAGTPDDIGVWKQLLHEQFGTVPCKDSTADKSPFRRWSVKVKTEIVALKKEHIVPSGPRRHLSPEEWQRTLEEEDIVLLDTRNAYETTIGKFRGAVDPRIASFSEFPAFVERANLPKEKKILMYCTGGIRCEKALLAMEQQGYENVFQLEGGILAYLEKFPQRHFEGECFVFDHRVAVDQHLQPSSVYGLCPHCGNAGLEDLRCFCGKEQKICTNCLASEEHRTCSKRCANEWGKLKNTPHRRGVLGQQAVSV